VGLLLRRCTVVTRVSARWLHILPTCFVDCTIQVKRELKNQDWSRASLKGCRFTGRLSGYDFGHRLPHLAGREHGAIKDCDFSEAPLDGCRFHGCGMRTLRLPRWPCFTILDPLGRSPALSRFDWPERRVPIRIKDPTSEPPSTVAVTLYAPAYSKGRDTTPDMLLAFLRTVDGVIY
jgi:hypothetical protein